MSHAIFIEGLDGSGKSTQAKLLHQYLTDKGLKVTEMREPGGSSYYEALRDLYLDNPHPHPPMSDALLSAAGRSANIAESRKALVDGAWVISDRSYVSSFAYQMAQGLPYETIDSINQHALGNFEYSLGFVIDVDTATAKSRLAHSPSKLDYWESQSDKFFDTISANYTRLASHLNLIVIDGSNSVDDIHRAICAHIDELLS